MALDRTQFKYLFAFICPSMMRSPVTAWCCQVFRFYLRYFQRNSWKHMLFSPVTKRGFFVFPVGPTKTIIESSSHSRHVFFRFRTMKRFSAAGEINK